MTKWTTNTTILAAVLAVASAAGAQAQLRPITIEDIRAAEKSGIPVVGLDVDDMQRFADCGIPVFGTGPGTIPWPEQMALFGEAKAAGVVAQIIWLRRNDAAIAECLARRSRR